MNGRGASFSGSRKYFVPLKYTNFPSPEIRTTEPVFEPARVNSDPVSL